MRHSPGRCREWCRSGRLSGGPTGSSRPARRLTARRRRPAHPHRAAAPPRPATHPLAPHRQPAPADHPVVRRPHPPGQPRLDHQDHPRRTRQPRPSPGRRPPGRGRRPRTRPAPHRRHVRPARRHRPALRRRSLRIYGGRPGRMSGGPMSPLACAGRMRRWAGDQFHPCPSSPATNRRTGSSNSMSTAARTPCPWRSPLTGVLMSAPSWSCMRSAESAPDTANPTTSCMQAASRSQPEDTDCGATDDGPPSFTRSAPSDFLNPWASQWHGHEPVRRVRGVF